ncbi:DUF255 domain-containing protein [Haloplanus sp. GCM10025708]|uniref:DUF255 domain-containing protein n=1 Tax=Haloferacaceae TaxID=1644056 RepID=UPI0036237238
MSDGTRVEWRDWSDSAFAEAREEGKPVLLALTATWCADCHEMDVETYGEPRIAANLNDGFVPIRVDVDRRPRVRERYNMGGFPSTVFLTPDGELLTGTGYLGPDGMRQVIDSVRELWDAKGTDAGRVPRALAGDPTPAGEVTTAIEEHLAGQLEAQFDEEHAGWGDGAKFPLPRTIEFALKRDRNRAVRTLEAVLNNLYDDEAGGFYRYARAHNWRSPHHAKLLDTNAALVRAFANAYLYTGEEAYRRPAERTVECLVDSLWNGAAFGNSQGPASGREYFLLDAEERAEETGPRTDLTAYAGSNGVAVDALLTLHAYTDADQPRAYATRALSSLLDSFVDDGAVVHVEGGDEALLLDDQSRVLGALTRAAQVVGPAYLDAATDVADRTIDALFDDGSFRDGPTEGVGLLDRPLRPLDGNVEMADALLDLAALTGEDRYRDVAHDAVAAFAGAWDRIGVQVAGYGSVAGRLCRPTLAVDVGTGPGSDLHRAALRVADHEKVVHPDADVAAGTAVVAVGDRSRSVTTPDGLLSAVADLSTPTE